MKTTERLLIVLAAIVLGLFVGIALLIWTPIQLVKEALSG